MLYIFCFTNKFIEYLVKNVCKYNQQTAKNTFKVTLQKVKKEHVNYFQRNLPKFCQNGGKCFFPISLIIYQMQSFARLEEIFHLNLIAMQRYSQSHHHGIYQPSLFRHTRSHVQNTTHFTVKTRQNINQGIHLPIVPCVSGHKTSLN